MVQIPTLILSLYLFCITLTCANVCHTLQTLNSKLEHFQLLLSSLLPRLITLSRRRKLYIVCEGFSILKNLRVRFPCSSAIGCLRTAFSASYFHQKRQVFACLFWFYNACFRSRIIYAVHKMKGNRRNDE